MNYAVIAAGEGSRLVAEGVGTPKPLVGIDGRPMIGRLIDIFDACGAESFAVIVNERMTEVVRYIENLAPRLPFQVKVLVRSTLGSMHSLHELLPLIPDGKFVLTTVDTVFAECDFRDYVARFESMPEGSGLMAVTDFVDDEKPLYVGVDADTGRITSFSDSRPLSGADVYVSGGVYGLDRRIAESALRRCAAEGYTRMRDFQRMLLAQDTPLYASCFSCVIDVDRPSDLEQARKLHTAGRL